MTLSATELYRRGRAHLNEGRNAAARRALTLAAARAEDGDLQARIVGSLASLTARQGDGATAERLCLDALSLTGLSAQTAAVLQGQLGLLTLERGDLGGSIQLFDEAIEGIGENPEHRGGMYINRSVAHIQAGRLSAAREDLERAVADFATTGSEIERAMAVHNAGYVALYEGDLIRALRTMREAYAALSAASAVNAAICELDRAEVLRDAGMATDAERSLERVAQVFGAHRMRQAKGEAEYHLARSQLSHAPDLAAESAARAARTFRRIGSEWWALRADAVRMRALLDLQPDRRWPRRIDPPTSEEVARIADELELRGLGSDATSLRLARQLWESERSTGGTRDGARIRVPADAPIQVRMLAHEVRSRRSAARGDDAGARRHAAAGIDDLAAWQASFGSLDLASSLVIHGGGLISSGLAAAARSRRPDVVFEWSERARHLAQQSVPLRPPPDAAMAADLAELRMIRAESEDWLTDPRARELRDLVRSRQWTDVAASGAVRRVTLDELQDGLRDDTAFLTFIFDGVGFSALVVAGGNARVVSIGAWSEIASSLAGLRSDLDMSAAVRSGPLVSAVATALETRLGVLSRILLDPVVDAFGDRRIVLTIPGSLGGIPWGMLPAMRGRVLTLATSASQWLDRSPSTRGDSVGLVTGPRVARAAEEVTGAGAAWPGAETLADEAATVDAVTALASRVDVLHVAAHGRHSPEHPLFSGLELADGALFGYDIDLIADVPDLVVMSSCEVGRSASRGGEEAIGMTRIWLHAGTSCVIAAPVVVADDVACELLGEMHRDLAEGAGPAEALTAASARTGLVAPFMAHGAGF